MAGEQRHLHAAGDEDPFWRLWRELPEPWKGPVVGDGIEDWDRIAENGDRRIDLTGLPDLIAAELAWMAHWQAMDGTRSSVLAPTSSRTSCAARSATTIPSRRRSGRWTGRRRPPCSGGSMPPAGAGSHPAAASSGCG
ncbi:hypothetical protein OG204_00375 [Streptomyces sp. NBC_01387]|uniref:hypothetical protein n=1 Tax=Streptomyces sp. NBC_01387 TaxID=2903849 RepID=UPI003244F929